MTIAAKSRSVRMFNEHTDAFLLVGCPGQELLGQSRPRTRLKRRSDCVDGKYEMGHWLGLSYQDREGMGVSRGRGRKILW